jgi:hypothetical protein
MIDLPLQQIVVLCERLIGLLRLYQRVVENAIHRAFGSREVTLVGFALTDGDCKALGVNSIKEVMEDLKANGCHPEKLGRR